MMDLFRSHKLRHKVVRI